MCQLIDHQVITMQELPELSPTGLLPRSVNIILERDLVDACKPGDRVYITGILRSIFPRLCLII